MNCIWCQHPTTQSEPDEHIFPDALGCPEDLIFGNGEVCSRCNNRNSNLDQALVAEFEMIRLIVGLPSKKGRPPTISHRPNAEGGYRNGAPFINLNMDCRSTLRGSNRNLKPYAARPNDLKGSFEQGSGNTGKITVIQNGWCNSKACVRSLHKIAFEVFAHRFGIDAAHSSAFDKVRKYVLRGKGERSVVVKTPEGQHPFRIVNFAAISDSSVFPKDVVVIHLACSAFTVDLSPNQQSLELIKEKHRQIFGKSWTWIPTL